MKILASDIERYVPQQRLVERVNYGTGFTSWKVSTKAGGAFYLSEYKGDGILSVLDAIVPIVGTVANVVSKGANFYKELRGNGIGPKGIEPEALAEVLKVEDAKPAEKAVAEESATVCAAKVKVAKTGKGFFFISPR